MKFLFDLVPIVLFFSAYKYADIYVATGVAIVASIAQVDRVLEQELDPERELRGDAGRRLEDLPGASEQVRQALLVNSPDELVVGRVAAHVLEVGRVVQGVSPLFPFRGGQRYCGIYHGAQHIDERDSKNGGTKQMRGLIDCRNNE